MEKEIIEKVAKILIESEWYGKSLLFLAKACNLSQDALNVIINGNKPEVTEEMLNEYMKKAEELLNNEENNEKKI